MESMEKSGTEKGQLVGMALETTANKGLKFSIHTYGCNMNDMTQSLVYCVNVFVKM